MGSWSIWHWLVVLVIVLVVFGTKRLTGGAKDVANAVKEFKKGMREDDDKPVARLSDEARAAEDAAAKERERERSGDSR